MNNQIGQVTRRTQQYWYIDGLNEIGFGFICILLWLYFWIGTLVPGESPINALYQSSMVLVIIGGAWLVTKGVTAAKERLTYPRTGFVEYRKPGARRQLLFGFLAMLVAFAIVTITGAVTITLDWMPALTGLVFGGVWVYLGQRLGIARFYLLAGVSVLLGLGLAALHLGNVPGMTAFYGLIGLALLVSGGFTLRHYLRHTHPPDEQAA